MSDRHAVVSGSGVRRTLRTCVVLAIATSVLVAPPGAARGAGPAAAVQAAATTGCVTEVTQVTCTYSTAGAYTWVAPLGLTRAHFLVDGGHGGDAGFYTVANGRGPGGLGGAGAEVDATLAVTGGHTYHVNVGGGGDSWLFGSGFTGAGGFNGGGSVNQYDHSGSGGGASDVRTGSGARTRILVAGGGGGGGDGGDFSTNFTVGMNTGGAGGDPGVAGSPGTGGCDFMGGSETGGSGGGAPQQGAGGLGGAGGFSSSYSAMVTGNAGGSGSATSGGSGAIGIGTAGAGGGGGGGYGGGGGGGGGAFFATTDNLELWCDGAGGGGAGGASYVDPASLAPGTTASYDTNSGYTGRVQITYSQIWLSAASGAPGKALKMIASGFTAGEPVRIALGTTALGTFTAAADGTVHTVVLLPAVQRGRQVVTATGAHSGAVQTGQFTVTPLLVTRPVSQRAGSAAKAGWFGLGASTSVTMYWDSTSGPELGHGPTDALGSVTIPFVVPAGAALGTHRLVAVTSQGVAVEPFRVTSVYTAPPSNPPARTVTLLPANAVPGQPVFVIAAGLPPGQQVTVTAGADPTPLAEPLTVASGIAEAMILVPDLRAGPNVIHVATLHAGLQVHPRLVPIPTTEPVGAVVTTLAAGFAPAESVAVHWNSAIGPILGSAVSDGRGTAVVDIHLPPYQPLGAHTLVAVDASSHQASVTVTLVKASTSIALRSSSPVVALGNPVAVVATVSRNAPATGVPRGTVTFRAERFDVPQPPFDLCTNVTLSSTGHARCVTTLPAAGSYIVGASYSGSAFDASTGTDQDQQIFITVR